MVSDSFIQGNEHANVAICTLWTPAGVIAKNLPREKFWVCANLFSIEGINTVIRSCLSNPRVRYLILFGVDSLKAGDIIQTFFRQGVDASNRVPNTSFAFHSEVPTTALEQVRKHVQLIDLRGSPVAAVATTLSTLKSLPAWGKPQDFPFPEVATPAATTKPKKPFVFIPDPKGNFVISLMPGLKKGEQMVIMEHYSADAQKSGNIFHSNEKADEAIFKDLMQQVLSAELISRLDHAMYLGEEISKAIIAAKQGKKYVQDRPLE